MRPGRTGMSLDEGRSAVRGSLPVTGLVGSSILTLHRIAGICRNFASDPRRIVCFDRTLSWRQRFDLSAALADTGPLVRCVAARRGHAPDLT
jgi:hypothetical protein